MLIHLRPDDSARDARAEPSQLPHPCSSFLDRLSDHKALRVHQALTMEEPALNTTNDTRQFRIRHTWRRRGRTIHRDAVRDVDAGHSE